MKVCVIIPAYNREAFIGSAVRSLLRQRDAADIDIVVVDDGSTDGTPDIVTDLAGREGGIRLVRQDRGGISRARNTGLANLSVDADLVTFLDSDDLNAPGRFATEIPLFEADPELALTYSLITLADIIDEDTLEPAPTALTCTLRGIKLDSALFRKNAIESVGTFNESLKLSEDWDFLIRFFAQPHKYVLLDHVSAFYRRHPGNITRNAREAQKFFLKVILDHSHRRRRDQTLGDIPKFFDYSPLRDERYASLR